MKNNLGMVWGALVDDLQPLGKTTLDSGETVHNHLNVTIPRGTLVVADLLKDGRYVVTAVAVEPEA